MLRPPSSADANGCVSVDIGVAEDGAVAFITMAGAEHAEPWPRIDLAGRQVWPGLVELHAHIDKSGTGERSPNPDGTLDGARLASKRDRGRGWSRNELWGRMNEALRSAWRNGTVALRSHIDSQAERVEPAWSLCRELVDAWSGRIELQAVATLGASKLMGPYGDELADLAARNGACLGPVIYSSPTLDAEIIRALDLAGARGLDLDFHVDETDDPNARGARRIAELVLEGGFKGRVVCGHVCSLALQSDDEAAQTIALIRQAGIGVVALPSANLSLQGRAPGRTPTWRGVTRVRELRAAGAVVAIGGDNCRDAFYPFGDHDLVDVLRDAVRIAHLDHPFAGWVDAISTIPATLMGLPARGRIAAGSPADLLVFEQTTVTGVLASLGRGRIVVRAGVAIDSTARLFAR